MSSYEETLGEIISDLETQARSSEEKLWQTITELQNLQQDLFGKDEWPIPLEGAIRHLQDLQGEYDAGGFDCIGGTNCDRMERLHAWFDDYVHNRIAWPIRDEDVQCGIIDRMEQALLALQHSLLYPPNIELDKEIIALHNWFHQSVCSPPYNQATGQDTASTRA